MVETDYLGFHSFTFTLLSLSSPIALFINLVVSNISNRHVAPIESYTTSISVGNVIPLVSGRPCEVSEILEDLVEAATPLADKQQRKIELKEDPLPLEVAVEKSALRQALSNLIEGALLRTHAGGKVQIFASGALAGGVLVLIDDDGPDMQYMTQMHSLTPFGADLYSNCMIQDNMTWNFVAGLTVAREILESYGSVVRVISPRTPDAALAAGGTRIELWLPTFESDEIGSFQEA